MTDAPWAWSLTFMLGACGTQSGNSGGGTPFGTGSGDSDGSAASGTSASSSGSSATDVGGSGMAGAEAGTSAPDAAEFDSSVSNDGALLNAEGGESGAPMPFIGCDRNAYPLVWTSKRARIPSGRESHGPAPAPVSRVARPLTG